MFGRRKCCRISSGVLPFLVLFASFKRMAIKCSFQSTKAAWLLNRSELYYWSLHQEWHQGDACQPRSDTHGELLWKPFSKQMRFNKIKKIRAAGLPSLRLLMHSLKVKKENAVNCAIFLTLTRIPGPPPYCGLSFYNSDWFAETFLLFWRVWQ